MATKKKTGNDKKALVFKVVHSAGGHWWQVDRRKPGGMVAGGNIAYSRTAYSRKDNARRAMLKFIEQVRAGNFEVEE